MPKRKLPIRPKVIKPAKKAKTQKGREIERRFLLKSLPRGVKLGEAIRIKQYYIDQRGKRMRIRESHTARDSKYDVTKKARIKDGVYDESITWIDQKTYLKLVPKAHKMITKLRYEVPCIMNGVKLKWEFDLFGSPLRLIIVEIEIPKEGFRIKMPKFIKDVLIMEVTHIKEMTNYALAEKFLPWT